MLDALDEFCVGNVTAQKQLIGELWDLGTSVLVTSRHAAPFTAGVRVSCPIVARDEDVRTYVAATLKQLSLLRDITKPRKGFVMELIDGNVSKSDTMFVCLHLEHCP